MFHPLFRILCWFLLDGFFLYALGLLWDEIGGLYNLFFVALWNEGGGYIFLILAAIAFFTWELFRSVLDLFK